MHVLTVDGAPAGMNVDMWPGALSVLWVLKGKGKTELRDFSVCRCRFKAE